MALDTLLIEWVKLIKLSQSNWKTMEILERFGWTSWDSYNCELFRRRLSNNHQYKPGVDEYLSLLAAFVVESIVGYKTVLLGSWSFLAGVWNTNFFFCWWLSIKFTHWMVFVIGIYRQSAEFLQIYRLSVSAEKCHIGRSLIKNPGGTSVGGERWRG